MTSPYPKSATLVVDASVLRGAGETAHPVSGMCRAFLEAIREGGFRVVSSPELTTERNRHASRFASRWFSNLVARKHRVVRLDNPTDPNLRAHLEQCAEQRAENSAQEANLYVALTKDACLIEASNACDKAPISSLDDRMRAHLRACADWVPEIKGVVWVNPANADEAALAWLDAGAPKEPERMLVP